MTAPQPTITFAIAHQGSTSTERTFSGERLIGGRLPECNIALDDQYVSSRHFQLEWDGTHYHFKDLGSSNGSWINGARTQEAVISEGDSISVGATQLAVRRIAPGSAPISVVARPTKTGAALREPAIAREEEMFFEKILKRVHTELEALWAHHDVLAEQLAHLEAGPERDAAESAHEAIHESLRSIEGALRNLEKDQRRMKALHAAAVMMNRVTDLKGRLNAILDLAIEIMEADCGFLILYDEKTEKTTVALHRGMSIFDESSAEADTILAESPTPSFSIAREVLRTRKSIAVTDLRRGSQFDAAQSVMIQGVLAVLCAPMLFDEQMIGLIYVDFRDPKKLTERRVGPGDRELFEAMASLAATAIQNAKFFRNVRIEVERRSSLQRYLSPELVDQVIRQNRSLNLGATRRQATVLFCDIRNFTPFAESTEPGQLIRQLNDYFSVMLKAITAENGSLDKFLGDGLMAFFGPLLELENSEIAAIRAACQMQRSMIEVNNSWRPQGWQGFEIGIGVNAGEVVAGNLGSSERLEYTVIGDTVNVASRLSDAAKPGQILVTQTVAERLPSGEFDVRPLDPIPLKGKSGKVPVFEVRY
jgi:adenylate cyclase